MAQSATANDTKPPSADSKLPSSDTAHFLADLGRRASEITIQPIPTEGLGDGLPASVPVGWDRKEQRLVSLRSEVEAWRLRPEHRTGTAKMQTLSAFIKLVNRHKGNNSAIFADMDWKAPAFTAVVDYHHDGESDEKHLPQYLRHRIVYPFPLSDEWKKWIEMNGEPMDQGAFAAFIEDRIAEIAAPTDTEKDELETLFKTAIADPFEVITLSRGLKVAVDATVGKTVTLQSGETEMMFEEVHRDGGGQKLVIPGLFMIGLPVFFRGEKQRLPVRLRYRVANGKVIWLYQLWRPESYVTEAVEKALDAVHVDTALPCYEGAPEN